MKCVKDNTNAVLKRLSQFNRKRVLIGIPGDGNARKGSTEERPQANNALIGYVMEHGDDEKHIPPRPFLVPGLQSVKGEIATQMGEALIKGLLGDMQACDKGLAKVGIIGQNAVQKEITDGDFEPLSPRTIEARARRGRKGAKQYLRLQKQGVPVEVLNDAGIGLAKPLLDSGQLRKAITFVVKK